MNIQKEFKKFGRDWFNDMVNDETPNAPWYERNMDLWNNQIGREVAFE